MSQILTNSVEREAVSFVAKKDRKERRRRYLACNRKNGQFACFGDADFANDWVEENGGVVIPFSRSTELPTWIVVRCFENQAALGGTLVDIVRQLGISTTAKTLRRVANAAYAAYNVSASAHNEKESKKPEKKRNTLPLLGLPKLPTGTEMAMDDIAAIFVNDDADEIDAEAMAEAAINAANAS